MKRLSRVVFILTLALGVLAPTTAPPAQADPIGGLLVIPGSGTNLEPIRLRTSAGCPTQATAYYTTMRGHGFPPDGQTVTSNTQAGLSHKAGFDVYVALVMQDYANENRSTLSGRYDITVYCSDHLTQKSYGEFTGALDFTSPTTYQAIGAAKPVGPPPPPLADPGSVGLLDPLPPLAGQVPAAGAEAQMHSQAGQLTTQRSGLTGQGVSWLTLVLVGAVFGALVAVVLSRQIGKHRS